MLAQHHRGHLFALFPERLERFNILLALQVFADRHVFHFRRDDALAGVVHLRDILARQGAARLAGELEAQRVETLVGFTQAAVFAREFREEFGVVTLGNPGRADRFQAFAYVNLCGWIGVGARGVVHENRRVLFAAKRIGRIVLADFAHRYADVGAATGYVNFAGIRKRLDGSFVHSGFAREEFGGFVH